MRGGRRRSRRTLRRAEDWVRCSGRKIAVDMERQGQPCLLLTGGRGSGAGHTAAAAGEAAADAAPAACEDGREELEEAVDEAEEFCGGARRAASEIIRGLLDSISNMNQITNSSNF